VGPDTLSVALLRLPLIEDEDDDEDEKDSFLGGTRWGLTPDFRSSRTDLFRNRDSTRLSALVAFAAVDQPAPIAPCLPGLGPEVVVGEGLF